jgi:putative photosynthetic complex assembly protein 2
MNELAWAALFAVFIWWFSTGLVLMLDSLPRGTFRWSLVASSALAVAALMALRHTAGQTSVAATYCAFTSALLVWGWHELSFLTGWVTGPRRQALQAGTQGWPRFVQAFQALMWHELAILAVGLSIVFITWGQPNQIGTYTFLVLWALRTSAKLNLFFGVRNLSEEFLPAHLAYLQTYFLRRKMNLFFPFALAASGAVLVWLVSHVMDPATSAVQALGLTLVGTLLALAILEHLLLVLPFSATALWRWAMRQKQVLAPALPTLVETPPTLLVSHVVRQVEEVPHAVAAR